MNTKSTEVLLKSFFDKDMLEAMPGLNDLLTSVKNEDITEIKKAIANLEIDYINKPTLYQMILLAKKILITTKVIEER